MKRDGAALNTYYFRKEEQGDMPLSLSLANSQICSCILMIGFILSVLRLAHMYGKFFIVLTLHYL